MVDRRPGVIARCAGVADVRRTLDFGVHRGLPISIRCGGHGVSGFAVCEGGVMIDLEEMTAVHVDPAARIARAQGGVNWGQFDHETQAFGLATTGGVVGTTGIAGLTLAGGHGMLMRRYGLACDNLRSADVLTADGRLLKASPSENEDLFWALRGGGPFAHGPGFYPNYESDVAAGRLASAFGAAKYERLRRVKRAYDPDNVFRLNQNIEPGEA
ncbi:MAG: FAD-binding oxidoreductase [Bryobacteraceae bacterium]|nr:FAD-binding oxidoreductase [Bryobacteraceae bacterium]